MSLFVECDDCGFVTVAKNTDEPTPRHHQTCPDCNGTAFTFTKE